MSDQFPKYYRRSETRNNGYGVICSVMIYAVLVSKYQMLMSLKASYTSVSPNNVMQLSCFNQQVIQYVVALEHIYTLTLYKYFYSEHLNYQALFGENKNL